MNALTIAFDKRYIQLTKKLGQTPFRYRLDPEQTTIDSPNLPIRFSVARLINRLSSDFLSIHDYGEHRS